jgi:hypothetical protein
MTRRRSSRAREWEPAARAMFARVSAAVYNVPFACAVSFIFFARSRPMLARSTGHLSYTDAPPACIV